VEGQVVVGRYRLAERLGSGGMGTVWRADDELLERTVAIKEVCIPGGLPDVEADRLRQRYLREARAAARLRHENVVVVYDVIPESARVWLVMELIDAPDLAALVRADGPLDAPTAAHVGLQILDALGAAHDAGVLHRDVKPANVLICANGRAVLTDFGVASVTGDASITATGQLIGSPAYLAPERLTGGVVGAASDLWALGCTLYAAVEGQSPFWRDEPFAIMSAITVEALPPPRLAGALTPVLLGLLEKDQSERWDADRTRAALERVVAGEAVPVARGWGAPAAEPPDAHVEDDAEPAASEDDGPTGDVAPAVPIRRRRAGRVVAAVFAVLALATLTAAVAELMFQPFGLRLGSLTTLSGSGDVVNPTPPPKPVEYIHPTAGYTVVLPAGWTKVQSVDSTYGFMHTTGDSSMQITVHSKPAGGKSSLQLTRHDDTTKDSPNYKRIRLEQIVYGEYRGTVLEFTSDPPGLGLQHAVTFRTVFEGVCYEVEMHGPSSEFDADWDAFVSVARSLRLPE
jgi:serine/threonine protein kinase